MCAFFVVVSGKVRGEATACDHWRVFGFCSA